MTRQPPILFLDVDGVLNVFPEDDAELQKRRIELPGDRYPHLLHPTEHTLPFMNWAWNVFDVRWCTAWGPSANIIAKWAELPDRPCAADVRSASEEWKLDGVRELLTQAPRTAVWIEDGISELAEAWVSKQEKFFYIFTDHRVGVTQAHAKFLADILDLPMEAWHGKR